ncbi:MAG TPA: hypothetical protein VIC35_11200 [Acidimicrobiia bacterium]
MQPFERLRYLARWTDEDGAELLSEAADCLAQFDDDPAGLVVACRRLLAHHPTSAPLWWLCARVLGSSETGDAAWEAWRAFRSDTTPERVATAIPFLHEGRVAVYGWPELIANGLAERLDLELIAVAPPEGDIALSRRLRNAVQPVRVVGETELLALEPTHLLVDAVAAGGGTTLVSTGAGYLAGTMCDLGATVMLVAGLGRALPERLFGALLNAVGDDPTLEAVGANAFSSIIGPNGIESMSAFARRADAPAAPELLRLPI